MNDEYLQRRAATLLQLGVYLSLRPPQKLVHTPIPLGRDLFIFRVGENVEECIEQLVREARKKAGTSIPPPKLFLHPNGDKLVGRIGNDGQPRGFCTCFFLKENNPVFERMEGYWRCGIPRGYNRIYFRNVESSIKAMWRSGKLKKRGGHDYWSSLHTG